MPQSKKKPKVDTLVKSKSVKLGNGKTAQVYAVKRNRRGRKVNVGYVVRVKGGKRA